MLEAKDKSSYNFLEAENKNREVLIDNDDFITEARNFLEKRGGYSKKRLQDRNEVYEQFLEHFRYQNVNEISAIRDLEYAQNANKQDKTEFANLIELYDTMQSDYSLETVKDFAGGILTAPSTYLGILTGGAGKLAAAGGTQASKLALKALLKKGLSKEIAKKTLRNKINKDIKKEIVKSAAITGTIEGTVGLGQAVAQEETRVETGQADEYDMGRVGLTTGFSFLGGTIAGGIVGKQQTKMAREAAKLSNIAESSEKAIAKKALEKAKKTLDETTDKDTYNILKEKIESLTEGLTDIKVKKGDKVPLDTRKVAVGKKLLNDITESKKLGTLEAGLPKALFQTIAAATLDLAKAGKFKVRDDKRITADIAEALKNGDITTPQIGNILKEYNLTFDTFSLIYKAELSEFGRALGASGTLAKQMKKLNKIGASPTKITDKEKVKGLLDNHLEDIKQLEESGITSITQKEARNIAERENQIGLFFKMLDRTRLGIMTSQLATTMRNFENAGFRTFIDAGTRAFDNFFRVGAGVIETATGMQRGKLGGRDFSLEGFGGGVADVYKGLLNPYEAQVVRTMFEKNMPDRATKLFRQAADLEANTAGANKLNRGLEQIGTKFNILNTFSDNIMKQAVLTASLKRQLGNKKFYDTITSGQFNNISDEVLEKAVQDSLEFVYQKSFNVYKGGFFEKIAGGTIAAHRNLPFVVSSFMPFPRYIANQFKFVYDHAPILGMLPASRKGAKEYDLFSRLGKQTMGLMMLKVAYDWRDLNGQDTEWFEFKDNTGKIIDGRPTYGPFAPFVLAADMLHRYFEADPTDVGAVSASVSKYRRDTIQSMLGSSFRTGYGVYALDKLMIDLSSGATKGEITSKLAGEFFGNILNTFTLPAAVVKDFYSQFDRYSRAIPETRTGEVDFLSIFLNRGTRALPDLGPDYDLPLRSPFREGDLMAINPIEKQLFGFSKNPVKNVVQKEMSELQVGWFDLYSKDPNETIDLRLRRELSDPEGNLNLVKRVSSAMKNPLYANLNRAERVPKFRALVKSVITEARIAVKEKIQAEEVEVGRKIFGTDIDVETLVTTTDIAEWNKLPFYKKNAVTSRYKRLYPLKSNEKFYEGKNIRVDADRIIKGVDGNAITVMQWALENAKDVDDI